MYYDAIIIGSGPAGITSGIYMKRAELNVLIISNNEGSLNKKYKIENYYGFQNPIMGEDLYKNGINQAKKLGINIINKEVVGIKYLVNGFEIITANQGMDEQYLAKFIVIATGANRKKVNIKGIDEFEGRGVSYCAVCDGPFFRNKEVAILGSGEYAIREIEELIPIAKNVTMLTNGEAVLTTRIDVDIEENKIKEIKGKLNVERIEFEDGTSKDVDGLFIAQGIASSIDFAKKIGAKINNNSIVVNNNMETSVPNVYACGDCTGGIMQISKAVYEGMISGLEIIKKYREEKGSNKNE